MAGGISSTQVGYGMVGVGGATLVGTGIVGVRRAGQDLRNGEELTTALRGSTSFDAQFEWLHAHREASRLQAPETGQLALLDERGRPFDAAAQAAAAERLDVATERLATRAEASTKAINAVLETADRGHANGIVAAGGALVALGGVALLLQ